MKSLEALDCEYLDLYLIHWPGVQKLKREDPKNSELRKGSWLALEKLYKAGLFILQSNQVKRTPQDSISELII